MIIQFKNKIIQFGGNMQFIVSGTNWPGTSGALDIRSEAPISQPFSLTLDLNDGTAPIIYNAVLISGTIYRVTLVPNGDSRINIAQGIFGVPLYANGNITNRTIKLKISNYSVITLFSFSLLQLSRTQTLSVPFGLMPKLSTIVINPGNSYLTEFTNSLQTIQNLKSLTIGGGTFDPTSRYYGYFQPAFINAGLTTLSLGGSTNEYTGKSYTTSNLKAINSTNFPLLNIFTCSNLVGGDDNGFSEGAFPIEWTTLPLTQATFTQTMWTKIPDRINQLSNTLQNLTVRNSNVLVDWPTTMSNLTNLNTINLTASFMFTSALPAYFSSLTNLKNMQYIQVFIAARAAGDIDTCISNWYNFITTNAAMTGANSLPFRGMSFDFRSQNPTTAPTAVQLPSGTYQQPTGFVLGSNNGTPTSSLERIWVMVNQYGHNWLYRTV